MKLEVSPSGRAGCRGCKKPVAKGEVRFAESFTMPGAEDVSYRYWHLPCAAVKLAASLKTAVDAYEGELPERAAIELAIANAPNDHPSRPARRFIRRFCWVTMPTC